MDSILNTIKQMLGIGTDDVDFDTDIMVAINMALSKLRQLGVGPESGMLITGTSELWENFMAADDPRYAMVQMYIYYTSKLAFDPPTNSAVLTSMKGTLRELESRIQYDEDIGHKSN